MLACTFINAARAAPGNRQFLVVKFFPSENGVTAYYA